MNLIEIRGQAKRHVERRYGHTAETMEEVYRKCKLVMDFMVERGINPERLQIRIVRPQNEPDETELAKLDARYPGRCIYAQPVTRAPTGRKNPLNP